MIKKHRGSSPQPRGAPRNPPPAPGLTAGESNRLVEELRVHQVELETQNFELRRTQAALQAAKDRYLDLYELAPVGYFTVNEDGLVLEANLTGAALVGEPRQSLIRHPFARLLLPEDADAYYLHRRRLLETGEAESWEAGLQTADGTPRWVRLDATLATSTSGIRRMRITASDITAQRRTAQELRRLGEAVRQTSATVMITDLQGRIEYVNPAFEALTGHRSAEALGQTPRILKSGAHDDATYRELWLTILAGKSWRGRLVNVTKAGVRYTEDTVIAPIRDEGGAISSFVSVSRDITHELELQQQLIEAQKLEGLGRLAGGVAHDFNNVMSVVLLAVDALQSNPPPASAMAGELVGEIREAALRARDLTRQLLGFARKQVFQPQVLDLGAVLRRSERLLRRVLGEHVALTVRAAPGPGLVRFDPGQLEQVILNLAMNARDAMPQGGSLTLAVAELDSGSPGARLYPDLPDGSYLELEVTDTGQGMTPKVAARAFEPFFTTKAVGKGHGLGLSTVHGIVKQNGGAIRCRTTPGQGTSFLLCLPRAPAGARVAPTLTPPAAVAPGRGSERVLLVEDDAEVLKAGVRVLEGSGYAVTVARDGLDALARVTSGGERFDLVVSDVVMPGLDGSALLGELRAHQPGLRALLVSGHGDDVLRDRAVLREGTEFLAKPFTSQELLSRVRRILDVGRVG